MNSLGRTKKLFITVASLMSVVVCAGIVSDMRFNSDEFMKDSEIKFVKRLDDTNADRYVASTAESDKPAAIINFPLNKKNKERINGKWKFYRFTDEENNVETKEFYANLSLIGNSLVTIENNNNFQFRISFLTDVNTIALVRKVNFGYEILEGRKVFEKIKIEEKKIEKSEVIDDLDKKDLTGIELDEMTDFALESVTGYKKRVSVGPMVENGIRISSTNIEDMIIETNEFRVEISYAELATGGIFNSEMTSSLSHDVEKVSGKVFKTRGSGKFRVTFFTGSLKGVDFNFTKRDLIDESTQSYDQEDNQSNDETINSPLGSGPTDSYQDDNGQDEITEDNMDMLLSNDESTDENFSSLETDNPVTFEEMNDKANDSGFSFNS